MTVAARQAEPPASPALPGATGYSTATLEFSRSISQVGCNVTVSRLMLAGHGLDGPSPGGAARLVAAFRSVEATPLLDAHFLRASAEARDDDSRGCFHSWPSSARR